MYKGFDYWAGNQWSFLYLNFCLNKKDHIYRVISVNVVFLCFTA